MYGLSIVDCMKKNTMEPFNFEVILHNKDQTGGLARFKMKKESAVAFRVDMLIAELQRARDVLLSRKTAKKDLTELIVNFFGLDENGGNHPALVVVSDTYKKTVQGDLGYVICAMTDNHRAGKELTTQDESNEDIAKRAKNPIKIYTKPDGGVHKVEGLPDGYNYMVIPKEHTEKIRADKIVLRQVWCLTVNCPHRTFGRSPLEMVEDGWENVKDLGWVCPYCNEMKKAGGKPMDLPAHDPVEGKANKGFVKSEEPELKAPPSYETTSKGQSGKQAAPHKGKRAKGVPKKVVIDHIINYLNTFPERKLLIKDIVVSCNTGDSNVGNAIRSITEKNGATYVKFSQGRFHGIMRRDRGLGPGEKVA